LSGNDEVSKTTLVRSFVSNVCGSNLHPLLMVGTWL